MTKLSVLQSPANSHLSAYCAATSPVLAAAVGCAAAAGALVAAAAVVGAAGADVGAACWAAGPHAASTNMPAVREETMRPLTAPRKKSIAKSSFVRVLMQVVLLRTV